MGVMKREKRKVGGDEGGGVRCEEGVEERVGVGVGGGEEGG